MKLETKEVIQFAKDYYKKPGNGAGGNLHIVLDDGNVRDSDISYCLESCIERNDTDGQQLALMLLDMSKTQRLKVYNSI